MYQKISKRRLVEVEKLNELYSHLINLRTQEALNADFKNYTSYKFAELGRFDYSEQDCFDFHIVIPCFMFCIISSPWKF